jgi:hypothetical protein
VRVRIALVLIVLSACGEGAPSDGWSEGPPLPAPRLEAGVVGFEGEVWVIGGFDEDIRVVDDTWILDADGRTWRAGPDAPMTLTHPALAVHGGRLYLLGGLVGSSFAPVGASFVLSGDRTGWEPLASVPPGEERGAAAVIVTADAIVLAGGAGSLDALATVLVYSPADDAWSAAPDLPAPRSHATGAIDPDGAPVVIGGLETLASSDPVAEVLALVDGAWQPRTPMPTARGGCSAAVLDGAVLCAGGEAGTSALRTLEAYDLAADTWAPLPRMPDGRAGTGGAAQAGRLVVPGGAHRLAFEPTADVAVFDPGAATDRF